MLYIKSNNTIRLTRGDTAALTVSIVDDVNKQQYEMKITDVLKLSVKKDTHEADYCFQKVSTGKPNITIQPEDTKELDFGKYIYDVQLENSEGAVSTIIEPSTFEVLPEVT